MSAPIAYKVDFKFENDVQLLDIVMDIFSRTHLNTQLSHKERTVLREYIMNGYSLTTKKSIRMSLQITAENLNTLNHTLQKKGFLYPHRNNQRLKVVSDKLLELKTVFLDSKGKRLFIVNMIENV